MPTSLIQKYLQEFARWIRNDNSYDDWEYGTEVIPGDKTWAKNKCNKCESCPCKIENSKSNS